jgi:hypothetical protein
MSDLIRTYSKPPMNYTPSKTLTVADFITQYQDKGIEHWKQKPR